MANEEQVALLKAGVEGWNRWRNEEPDREIDLKRADLQGVNLPEANLRKANLEEANLRGADLPEANLRKANLMGANLNKANLWESNLSSAVLVRADLSQAVLVQANLNEANLLVANLSRAYLGRADLKRAELTGANLNNAFLRKADLSAAILINANLVGADLSGANFSGANLSETDLTEAKLNSSNLLTVNINNAKISKSHVYGVNVWDLKGEFKEQKDLVITPPRQSPITVDNIKVAQFVYLILNNKEIRDVINTLTSKTVLILGRFAIAERKAILDALRNKLREYDLLPIVFDFDRPTDQDFTETIKTLASISYFVIADVTNPKSSPLELQATIPDYQIPFVPIIQEGEVPFAMMKGFKKYGWVLDTISYDSLDTLIEILKPHIIDPAIRRRDELRLIKAKEPTIISGRELRDKGKL